MNTSLYYKPVSFFLLCATLFCCSSCFQVIEEVSLKTDGSGDAKFTFNLSHSKAKVASILLLDSINGYKVPSEKDIRNYMNEAVEELKKTPGITNIRQSLDMKSYIASISFSFKDVTAVNNLAKNLLKKQKSKQTNPNNYAYDPAAAQFKREYTFTADAKSEYNKLKSEDKNVFKTASYTCIHRFEKNIVSASNKLTKISPSGKALMINVPVMDIINGKTSISNTVQLSK